MKKFYKYCIIGNLYKIKKLNITLEYRKRLYNLLDIGLSIAK